MNKRNMIMALVSCSLLLGLLSPASYAFDRKGDGGHHRKSKGGCKFYQKAHFILRNQDELDLSDSQVAKLKELKLATKKAMIAKKAEIETVALDIKAGLWNERIDIVAMNKLIDQKYDLKKAKAKMLIGALAKLKNTLTKEQKEKLKKLYKECKVKKK